MAIFSIDRWGFLKKQMLDGGPVGNHHLIHSCLLFTNEITEVSLSVSGSQPFREERHTDDSALGMMEVAVMDMKDEAKSPPVPVSSRWLPWSKRSSAPALPSRPPLGPAQPAWPCGL